MPYVRGTPDKTAVWMNQRGRGLNRDSAELTVIGPGDQGSSRHSRSGARVVQL
jgi:hypothetical protein